nr:hypothetical protein [Maliibacterium massiliense]
MTDQQRAKRILRQIQDVWTPSASDPLGSWTGVPEDAGDKPVQDADDL